MEQGYILENGTALESTYELEHFVRKGVQAILYRHMVSAFSNVKTTDTQLHAITTRTNAFHIALREPQKDDGESSLWSMTVGCLATRIACRGH